MKKFYVIIALFILFSSAFMAQGQIIYKNANTFQFFLPQRIYDFYMVHEAYPQASDFIMAMDSANKPAKTSEYRVRILPQYIENMVLVSSDSMVKVLSFGDLIDGAQTVWTSNNLNWMTLINTATGKGNWDNVANRFIGLKMNKNGDDFYGWAQMTIAPGTSQPTVTLFDMAFQKTTGKSITAGQTVGMNHIIINSAKYILNDRQLNILTDRAENLSITDISGHQLLNADVKSNKSVDLSAYPNGIYLVRISTDNGIMTDKIILR
jgi:hypothetical protein